MNMDEWRELAIYNENELGDARTNRKYCILHDMLSIYTACVQICQDVWHLLGIEWIKYVATVCTPYSPILLSLLYITSVEGLQRVIVSYLTKIAIII